MLRIPFPSEAEVTTGFNSRCLKRLANWLEGCKRVAAGNDDWATRASSDAGFRRAFAETIVCGMTGMHYPAPDDLLAATEVYCDHLPPSSTRTTKRLKTPRRFCSGTAHLWSWR